MRSALARFDSQGCSGLRLCSACAIPQNLTAPSHALKTRPAQPAILWLLGQMVCKYCGLHGESATLTLGCDGIRCWQGLTLSRLGFSGRSRFGKSSFPFKLLFARTAGVITLLSHAGLEVPSLHGKSMTAAKIDASIEF